MASCVLITEEQYQLFEKEVKIDRLDIKAIINSIGSVPTVEELKEYIKTFKSEDKDVKFERSSINGKIGSLRREIERLTATKVGITRKINNQKQLAVIDKLIQGHYNYIALMENYKREDGTYDDEQFKTDFQSISVSNFKGASPFTGDPTIYQDYNEFGNLLHSLVERISQMPKNFDKSPSDYLDRMTKEDWLKFIRERREKEGFKTFESLSDESVYDMLNQILPALKFYVLKDYVLIPELSLTANGVALDSKLKITARVDILAISPEGKLSIIDLKTKRVRGSIIRREGGVIEHNLDNALVYLTKSYGEVDSIDGKTFKDFITTTRNTYDDWFIQLQMYNNILEQNGFETSADHSIFALLYDTTEDRDFMGNYFTVFQNHDYYTRLQANLDANSNSNMKWADPEATRNTLDTFRQIVDKAIPVKEVTEAQNIKRNLEDSYDIQPSELQAKTLIEYAKKSLAEKIAALDKDLSNSDINPELNELRKNRKAALLSLQRIILENDNKGKNTGVYRGILFASTLEGITAKIGELNYKLQGNMPEWQDKFSKGVRKNDSVYSYEDGKFIKNGSEISLEEVLTTFPEINEGLLNKYQSQLTKGVTDDAIKTYSQIFEIYKQNASFGELLQILYDIANNVKNNNKDITEDSPILKNLYKALSDNAYVNALFKQASIPMMVNVLKSVGEKNFNNVKTEINQVLALRLQKIEKEIVDLQNGEGFGIVKKTMQNVISWFNKSEKAKLQELKDRGADSIVYRIEKLQAERDKIQAVIFDLKGDTESLTRYIEAMSNPDSPLYLGARDLYNPTSPLNALNPNQFQASITDQDLGIASVMIIMKNAEGMAHMEIVNDAELHEVDRLTKKLQKDLGLSIEGINQLISQKRKVIFYDKATGEKKESTQLFFVKPYTDQYEADYKEFQVLRTEYKKKIKQAKSEYNDALRGKDQDKIETTKNNYQELVKLEDQNTKAMINWMVENCNLPFIDDYYKLQAALPEQYRTRIQDVYLEMYIINREDPTLMTDDDYDKLLVLKAELKKIKQEARKENEEYNDILNRMQDMYNPQIDYDRFNAYYKQMSLQLSSFPEGWAKWKAIYTISRPNQAWYEKRAELYDRMSALFPTDNVMSELYKRRNELIRPYKINGVLNTRIIPSETIIEIDGIENEIDDYINLKKASGDKLFLEPYEQFELEKIKNELSFIQVKKLSPTYTKEFDKRNKMFLELQNSIKTISVDIIEARKTGDTVLISDLENKLQATKKMLVNYSEDYVKWYNERHVGSVTVEQLLSQGIAEYTAIPKPFNYEFTPTENTKDKYMDIEIPNPDYFTTFELKEEAKNPNYIDSIDKIPMPKGIVQTGKNTYNVTNVTKYTDPMFVKIKSNTELSNYYDKLTTYFFSLQNKMEGVKTGYRVPGFNSSITEDFHTQTIMGAVKKRLKLLEDRAFKLRGEIDASENIYGDVDSNIRARFTRQLSEDLQSLDAVGAVYKFATEAHYNKSMQIVKPQVEGFIEYVKDEKARLEKSKSYNPKEQRELDKRVREWSNMISVLESERDKFIKGQPDDPKDREVKKIINNMFMYVSMIRIGFDVTNQVKNYTAGSIQFWIAAGNNSKHYTSKDALFAYNKIYGAGGFLKHYFADWGKISDISESTMLYRIMNPLQKDMMKYVNEITGGKKRRLLNTSLNLMELGYMIQDKGDTLIGLTTMYSVMNHYKYKLLDPSTKTPLLDKDGNPTMISAHKCYYKAPDGTLRIREDVDYTVNDQLELKRIIIAEMRRAQGNYASSDATRMERETIGKLAFFFRKFLIPLMMNRFGNLKPSWETGEAALGYWKALAQAVNYFGPKQALTEFFLGFVGEDNLAKIGMQGVGKTIEVKDSRSDETITINSKELFVRKITQARRDAIAMTLLTVLSSLLLFRLKQRDDDDEIGAIEGNLARLIWLTKMETLSMFPFAGQSSQEYVKNFSTVIPFTKEATAGIKSINHMMKYLMVMLWQQGAEPDSEIDSDLYQEWYKDAFYMQNSGAYEQGTPKWTKDLVDFTGFRNIRDIFQPENRLEQLKKNQ